MPLDRLRPPPRERTFAEVFPWRNIRRAAMLVLLIVAIVVIKRSTGGFLNRVGSLWATPVRRVAPDNETAPRVRLGPGLAPRNAGTDSQ